MNDTTPTEATKAVARAILREMYPDNGFDRHGLRIQFEEEDETPWLRAINYALAAEKARPDLPVVTVPEGWALVPVRPTEAATPPRQARPMTPRERKRPEG